MIVFLLNAGPRECHVTVDGGPGAAGITLQAENGSDQSIYFLQGDKQAFEVKRGKKSLLNVQASGEITWGIQANVSYFNIEGAVIHASKIGE